MAAPTAGMGSETVFDTVIAIDWSATTSPKRGADSIWIATSTGFLANPPTRLAAERQLIELLAGAPGQTLIAIDVALGYPAGTAAALGLRDHGRGAWWSTWDLIASLSRDDDRNRNNRFEVAAELNRRIAERTSTTAGPFWGRPPSFESPSLAPTKPAAFSPLAEFRATELALRAAGHSPKSVWQLLGNGAVGSQSLTAIPMLYRLMSNDDRISVWPFMPASPIVVAEVWPSLYLRPADAPIGMIPDAAQMRAVVDAFGDGADLTPSDDRSVVTEEGWVLVGARP